MSVYTSYQATNTEVLKEILSLYAKPKCSILDMTYGEGKFWSGIDLRKYSLATNDLIKDNPSNNFFDFRRIPLPDHSFDLCVLDPPYVHGMGSANGNQDLSHRYGIKTHPKGRVVTNYGYVLTPLTAQFITKIYKNGMKEAWRLLKPNGILILKTQDEIESGKQVWRHFELKNFPGFRLIDMFIVTQKGKPLMRHKHQHHARKNHSYFMIYRSVD